MALKPDHAQGWNALGYTLADRTDRLKEAREYIEKALQLAPDDPFILDSMGWVHYRLGNHQLAVDYLRRAFELRPDPEIAAHLGEALWMQGRRDEAQRLLAGLEESDRAGYVSPYEYALVHAGLGDRDAMYAALEKAVAERSDFVLYLGVDSVWRDYRAEPRFVALLRRIGLAT